jgi:acyl dehydratase
MAGMIFEDVQTNQPIPDLVRGPLGPPHLMRWSSAIENWHRIHYDRIYAVEHDGLPDILINGSWKQHLLMQLVGRWTGSVGWLWQLRLQFRKMNVVGETLTAWGRVTSTERRGAYGIVGLEVGIRNQDGTESTPGTADVVLPVRGGPAVPYPFTPEVLAG